MFCTNSAADEKIGRFDIADGFWRCVIGRSKRRGKRGIGLTGKYFLLKSFLLTTAPGFGRTAKLNGPFSVIQSFTKYDLKKIINGGPFTMEIHDTVFRNHEGEKKVAMLVKQYIVVF